MEFKELFEPIINFIKGLQNKEKENSKDEAKKRLQLVLMQDRASVSPDFFEMMKKEIIEVIKKYIEIDEDALEVQLTRGFEDGVTGPALFANIPIKNIKPVAKKAEAPKKEENKNSTADELEVIDYTKVEDETGSAKNQEDIADEADATVEEKDIEKKEENEKDASAAKEDEEKEEVSNQKEEAKQETKTEEKVEEKKEELKKTPKTQSKSNKTKSKAKSKK